MKFAFVTDELPRPGSAGHLAYNDAVIGWLQGQGHEVIILLVRPRLRLPIERFAGAGKVIGPGVTTWRDFVVSFAPGDVAPILAKWAVSKLPSKLAGKLRKRGRAQDYGVVDAVLGAFTTSQQVAWCVDRLLSIKPDAVLIDTIFRSSVLDDPRIADVNSVIIAHDLFHLRHRALASAGYRLHPATLSRAYETSLLNKARTISAIQPDEAAIIRAMCPDRIVTVNPMPARPCIRPAATKRLTDRLVFVGGDTLPNLDGLRWFFDEIWPRLRSWRATITLDLVGDCGAALGTVPTGVYRVGRVQSLDTILHRASLAIAPLRVGSGLKVKMLDYARHGLTTIATPLSLQGFAADPHAPFIAASDAISFSSAISKYLQSEPTREQERQSFAYIKKYYGIESNFLTLGEALQLQKKLHNA